MQKERKVIRKVGNYKILDKVLGEGSYGIVHLGVNMSTERLVAVKIVDKQIFKSMHQIIRDQTITNLERESLIHKQLDHPNILKLEEVLQTPSNIYFFLELCDHTLKYTMKKKEFIIQIFSQIVSAFLYLSQIQIDDGITQSKMSCITFGPSSKLEMTFGQINENVTQRIGVCHRDLKPSNILVKNNQIKIGDFGLSKGTSQLEQTIGIGTPFYNSPLTLQGKESNDLSKNDVWAAGIILYEMLYQKHPWKTENFTTTSLLENIIQKPLVFPNLPNYSNYVKDLLTRMLDKNEETRISWKEISEHDWLKYQLSQSFINAFEKLDINQK